MNNRSGAVPILLVVLVVLVAAGGVGYFAFMNTGAEPTSREQQPIVTSTPADDVSSWILYTNTAYGYRISHPRSFVVEDSITPQGACVYLLVPETEDRILLASDKTEEPCTMTTGRGAYDKRITGTLTIGTTSYAAKGWSSDTDYEELSVSVPHGERTYWVSVWVNRGNEFTQRKELITRILSTFAFTSVVAPVDTPAL